MSRRKPPPGAADRQKAAAGGKRKLPPLSTQPPHAPLSAERGEWRAPAESPDGFVDGETEEQQLWSAYCVARETRFQGVVTPAWVILRVRRDRDSIEFCRIGHEGFSLNEAMRAWVTAVFGTATLAEVDGEIARLAKRQATGLPYGADIWQPGTCDFEGSRHACLERITVQTRTRVFLSADEVIVDRWWYHPQYDDEPNTLAERFAIADFMRGDGQLEVLETFGTRALDRMLDECRKVRPSQAVRDVRAPGRSPKTGRWHWLGAAREVLLRQLERLPAWPEPSGLGGGCALILLLIIAGTLYLMATPLSWWWHGRVADDLVALPAVVVAHELVVETRSISGGHKRSSQGIRTVYTPQIGFRPLPAGRAADAPEALKARQYNTVRDMPGFSAAQETRSWMRHRHPLGQEVTLWFRPQDVDAKQADFIHSREQLPDGWDLLRELIINVLLTTFIYLPLVVLALMGVGMVGLAAVTAMARRRRP